MRNYRTPIQWLFGTGSSSGTCLVCQSRLLHNSSRRLQKQKQEDRVQKPEGKTSKTQPDLSAKVTKPRERQYERYRDGELQPKPLNRPLGLPHPPLIGQNSGRDDRSWSERKEDFLSYDKHLERRKHLTKQIFQKNYYRDIGNLGSTHQGKSILAPTTPYRASLALYFPNLQGRTLSSGAQAVDTTPVLRNRVTILSMVNTKWAEEQAASFTSAVANPALAEYMEAETVRSVAQEVLVNVEENWMKSAVVKMLFPRLRKVYPKGQHGRYFLVERGLTDEIRDALGMWNSKVGYVYLLDGNCKIRWAGNGNARVDEKVSLVNCLKRLVTEAVTTERMKVQRQDARPGSRGTKTEMTSSSVV